MPAEPPDRVTEVDPVDFDWSADRGPAADVREVVHAAADQDGSPPLDEAALLALRHGLADSHLWAAADRGFAWRHATALDLAVAPVARGQGLGTALAGAAADAPGALTAWSHGHYPAASALAARLGFERVRDLWVMRRPLADLPAPSGSVDGVSVQPFVVGADEDAFLRLNAEAFAHHREQGGLTRADLDERMAEAWFDPAGLFLAWRDDELVGFHWTKVHGTRVTDDAYGEVYVVGVSPHAQGGGLGRALTLAGLEHLAGLGLSEVILYVEADNDPAVAVYRRLGFTHADQDTHVQYARP